jgi:phosphotransferase system IIB component
MATQASDSKYDQLAHGVLRGAGGAQNVASVTRCATRLRFHSRTRRRPTRRPSRRPRGVITVVEAGGQPGRSHAIVLHAHLLVRDSGVRAAGSRAARIAVSHQAAARLMPEG